MNQPNHDRRSALRRVRSASARDATKTASRHPLLILTVTALVCATSWPAAAQKFSPSSSFPTQDASSAPHGMIAVGPSHILVITHEAFNGIRFYSKSTLGVLPADFSTVGGLFGIGTHGNGDPVAHYDALNGRFIILTMGDGSGHYLAISKAGADPTLAASWWKYHVGTSTGTGIDQPGLGLSDDKLAIIAGGLNLPQTIHVLDRAAAYAGTLPAFPALVPVPSAQQIGLPETSRRYKVCRNLTADAALHVVGYLDCDEGLGPCDLVTYQTVTGLPASPALSSANVVVTGTDQDPAPGDQLGAPAVAGCQPKRLMTWKSRPGDLYMRSGSIAVAWCFAREEAPGTGRYSAVHCVRFRTSDRAVLDDFVVGSHGRDYSFPSATVDKQGAVLLGFGRVSANERPTIAMLARRGGVSSPEYTVKVSDAAYIKCQNGTTDCPEATWGDYTSMTVDESATTTTQTKAYYLGQWAKTGTTGSTYVGRLNASYGNCSVSGTVQVDINGVREPRPGAPVVLVQGGANVAETTTDANGAFSFGSLPAGTYILTMAWDPAVGLEAQGGTGAYLLLEQSPTELYMQLKPNNQCVGNVFVVAKQSFPSISAISPLTVAQSGSVTLTASGSGLSSISRIRFDGREKGATTYDPGTNQLQVTIPGSAGDFARHGVHWISVFNPAASGAGISNRVALQALAPFLAASTVASEITACPGGDAGHLTASVTVQGGNPECGVDLGTATAALVLTQRSGSGLSLWEGAEQTSSNPVRFEIPGTPTGGGQFSFDVGKVSGCGVLEAAVEISSALGPVSTTLPSIDVKSFDLEASVLGAVDQFDQSELAGMPGFGGGCGDFDRDHQTNQSDATALEAHLGHRAQEMRVVSPNGSQSNLDRALYGGEIPFTVSWVSGAGPEAKVTIHLLDGANVTTLAANVPDDGSFDWAGYAAGEVLVGYCEVPASTTERIEVVYSAGDLPPGSSTPGVYLGSDQSDQNFRISHECNPAKSAQGGPQPVAAPTVLQLLGVHPNPASTSTAIRFGLPQASQVDIGIYNAAGRLVRVIADGRWQAGYHTVTWDLLDQAGAAAASGVYYSRMTVGDWRKVQKVLVAR